MIYAIESLLCITEKISFLFKALKITLANLCCIFCSQVCFNPLNAELNPIYHLPPLLEALSILHFSRVRVKPYCSALKILYLVTWSIILLCISFSDFFSKMMLEVIPVYDWMQQTNYRFCVNVLELSISNCLGKCIDREFYCIYNLMVKLLQGI